MSDYGYNAVFTSFFHTDEDGVESRFDAPTLNLDCNNGYWTGPGRPLLAASGWFEAPEQLRCHWNDMDEETARWMLLTSYGKLVQHFWYEWRWFGNPDSPTRELVWAGDRSQWDRTDMLTWCPYPDWDFLPSSGRMGAACFG